MAQILFKHKSYFFYTMDIQELLNQLGQALKSQTIKIELHHYHHGETSDSTKKEKKKSTGFGLSIVKTLVDKTHGTIQVRSEVAKGTEFRISYPRAA